MELAQTKNCVMDEASISKKMRRMALQVAEQNFNEPEIIVAGIEGNGTLVAKWLIHHLKDIISAQIHQLTIGLNKQDPREVKLDPDMDIEGKVVLVVDDVADTGRTMLYALKPFLDRRPRKIQTLVLVERSHKLFPIQTDYSGLSLATTLQEHIRVSEEQGRITGAWLF